MAKRTVLIVDDISGVATPEEDLKQIEYVHPVNGKTYVLMTTEDNLAAFNAKLEKQAAKMDEVRTQANADLAEARKAAVAVYEAALAEAEEKRQAALANLGAPVETLIAKSAKGYADWEEKKQGKSGRPSNGQADPARAAAILEGKRRSAFIRSTVGQDLANPAIRALMKKKIASPRGPWNPALTDFLEMHREIWDVDNFDATAQPALV